MSFEDEDTITELRSKPRLRERDNFHAQYRVSKTLGRGGYAMVKLAYHRLTGAPVAVKMLRKRKLWCYPVMSEVDIMMMTNHPNIISLLQVIDTEKMLYLVMELAEGQQLYQYVRNTGYLSEDEARDIFRQIVSAVSYCHENGIIHRDLKPDNIMVDNNGKVKIIDFGLGTQVQPGQKLSFHCGTYTFGAPELFLGKLYDGPKVDIWTMGLILYFMVVGHVPFEGFTRAELRKKIVAGMYTIPSDLSEELQDLLSLLMTLDPNLRPTIDEVMTHPWLREDEEGLPNHHCEEMIPSSPDPAIVAAMEHMGFQAQDIKDSLRQRKFNQTMASYCFLQEQALREHGCTTRAQPINPGVTPFPSLEDPVAFPLEPRRRGSEPALSTLLRGSPANGQQAGQKGGRHATRAFQRTPTLDPAQHQRTKSAPCIHSVSGENTEDNLGSVCGAAEGKSVRSQGQPRGWRGWTRRIGSAMMRLCCCIPSRKKPRRGQNRVSPRK